MLLAAVASASEETLRTFDACRAAVEKHFYDKQLHGVDWDAIVARYRPLADRAAPGRELRGVLQRLLAELDASHATILERDVYVALMAELRNRRYPTCGVLLEESRPGEIFVRDVYEGGPAEQARLLVGDRIVGIGGRDPLESTDLVPAGYDPRPGFKRLFYLRGRTLRLGIRRSAAAPAHEVVIKARAMNGVDATRASVRVIRRGAYRVGTLHVWFCQVGAGKVVEEALAGALKDCDALVLDVRGRGGYPAVGYGIVKHATAWGRPVVYLADHRTRSAKEGLLNRVRLRGAGVIVGEKTEGASLGAGFFPLPDGSWVELPIMDPTRYTDGVKLEKRGVAPHIETRFAIPYAAGADPILEQGVRAACRLVAARRGWETVKASTR
jgi:C-terminal processing protease CtpA/Prc